MAETYYKPCSEFDRCNELIEKYWNTKQFEKCFEGHMELAEKGYPLAECQVGYFFYDGIGVEKDADKAFYWTQRAAEHGIVTANSISHVSMKKGLGRLLIWKRQSTGIRKLRSRTMILPSKNART